MLDRGELLTQAGHCVEGGELVRLAAPCDRRDLDHDGRGPTHPCEISRPREKFRCKMV